jgi:hypothetical protein
MSVEVVRGGHRRIDRVLDPRFVVGVGQLDLAELQSRRLPELDVEELTRAVEVLAHEEESASTHRRAVQRVVDLLRGELAGRYRDGGAHVSQLLE